LVGPDVDTRASGAYVPLAARDAYVFRVDSAPFDYAMTITCL